MNLQKPKSRRAGIACPRCGWQFNQVVRVTTRGDSLQRQRECQKCCHRFLTREASKKSDTRITFGVDSLINAMNLTAKKRPLH